MSKRSQAAYRGSSAVGYAIQLYLGDQFRALEKIAPDLEHGDADIVAEAVHDLRVTCQQMRSVLQAFAAFLPAAPRARLDRRIHRLQHAFSEVRDLQILLAQPELISELRQRLERRQAAAMRRLLEKTGSRQICSEAEKMCDRLSDPAMEVALSPRPLTRKGVVQLRRLDTIVPVVLYSQAAAVTAFRPFIPIALDAAPADAKDGLDATPADVEASQAEADLPIDRFWENPAWPSAALLHRLRLAFKQFRHVLMMLSPLWGSLGNNLIAVCKQMQDDLGHLHDRQALAMALFAYAAEAGSDTGSDTSSDTGAAAAVASRWPQIKAGQEAALRDFLERWQTMDMFWFQRQLLPLVEWSARQASSTSSALTENDRHPEQSELPKRQSGRMDSIYNLDTTDWPD